MKYKNVINNRHALTWAVVGWLDKPGTIVFWSTHNSTTACDAQRRVVGALMHTNLDIERVIRANGAEEIRLANSSRVIFRARTVLSYRGFSADKLILDEASELMDKQLVNYLPIVVSRPDGEVIYAQTEDPRA